MQFQQVSSNRPIQPQFSNKRKRYQQQQNDLKSSKQTKHCLTSDHVHTFSRIIRTQYSIVIISFTLIGTLHSFVLTLPSWQRNTQRNELRSRYSYIDSDKNWMLQLQTKLYSRPKRRYDQDNDDEEEDEDDEPPEIGDVSAFRMSSTMQKSLTNSIPSFGYNKGRSSPTTRKAIGKSSSSIATIYLCTHCGSEYVQWMGRCPTCKEWNTIQEHVVGRSASTATATANNNNMRPIFGASKGSNFHSDRPVGSWLDDIPYSSVSINGNAIGNVPIRITDLISSEDVGTKPKQQQRRIVVPDDDEFNTVLGGGIMKGSLILLGGDPGVGKSTLLLQIAGTIAAQLSQPSIKIGMGTPTPTSYVGDGNHIGPVWYVSGEENPDQIASRAARLGIGVHGSNKGSTELYLLRQTHVDTLCEQVVSYNMNNQYNDKNNVDDDDINTSPQLLQPKLPISLLVIDSIQTMVCDAGGSSYAGGITQVRECVAMFLRLAKSINLPILLIGHVTKSGEVAGPRTVEHMVDCVLYLDGINEGNSGMTNLRMLRASKNRFGSSDEVGVYEMTHGRLLPVSDPSSLFLAHRNDQEDAEGCAIAIALEGMRAMTVEVQALVTLAAGEANYGGRRTVNGIAHSRLLLLLGVLQKRCYMFWSKQDVYINVVGRIQLDRGEGNAADLAIAVALASSRHSIAVRADTAFVGEIGLLGELRNVPAIEKRLHEARRMGFSRVITPRDYKSKKKTQQQAITVTKVNGIEWIQCTTLFHAINEGLVHPIPKRTKRQQPSSKSSLSYGNSMGSVSDDNLQLEILDDDDYDDNEDVFR